MSDEVEMQGITGALPKGDPFWTVYAWRQDSITLLRIRPYLEELFALAEAPCGYAVGPYTCLNADPNGDPTLPVCLACRLKLLRARLHVANLKGST